jgi:hypothetical protein
MAHRSPRSGSTGREAEEFVRLIARGVPNAEEPAGLSASTDEPGHASDSTARSPAGGRATAAPCPVISTPTAEISPSTRPRKNGSRSPTSTRAGMGCGTPPPRTDRTQRRSAGNCGVTENRKPVGIVWRCKSNAAAGGPVRSPGIRCCGASCVEPGTDQPRAARRVPPPPGTGTWCTRRSTRRLFRPDRPTHQDAENGSTERKPHRHPDSRRARRLVDMTMIDERPTEGGRPFRARGLGGRGGSGRRNTVHHPGD